MTIVEKIVSREMEAVIVYESDNVIAFADHDPINFGHILICPTYPYTNYIDLPEDVLTEIQSVARQVYKRIQEAFKPDGISFLQITVSLMNCLITTCIFSQGLKMISSGGKVVNSEFKV